VLILDETAAHLAAELADGLLHVVHLLPVAKRLINLGHVQVEVGHIRVAALAVQDHLRDDGLDEHPIVLSVGSFKSHQSIGKDYQLAKWSDVCLLLACLRRLGPGMRIRSCRVRVK